jgi:ubiquinol-cytochrome c reductase iron-sulfur subunit
MFGTDRVMAGIDQAAQPARRDFIVQTAQAFVGVGTAAVLWPFVAQMNPNKGSPPPEVKEVDLTSIQPGQMITVQWRGAPILIRHRTPEEVAIARIARASQLPDRFARNDALPSNAPADDVNRTKVGHDNWLVVVGLCTHMGCFLKSHGPAATLATGEGWLCPCHAARFDLSGRVVSGPARTNLPVPPYIFISDNRIRIG